MTQPVSQPEPPAAFNPAVEYEEQMELLVSMGFEDPVANLAALSQAKGDIQDACTFLINQQGL